MAREDSGGDGASARPLLDDATLHHWSETGARRIRAKLSQALAVETDALGPDAELYKLLYELVGVVVHAKLTRQEVVSVLKEVELSSFPEACETFLDLVWVVGNEIEASEKGRERHSSPEWQQLCRFVKAIADEEVVPLFILKTSLEFDLLHQAGLVSEPLVMKKKILRINTKSLYTQRKYNLLREESEGFAKVLSLLHTSVTPTQLEACQTDLMALIGYFDLDASRVLDLVLDAYEMQPQNACFVTLLGAFKRASIPHILGFKFQFYKRDAADGGLVTPRSLYRLAATLLANGLVDLDALLPHLAPSKDEIVAQYSARIQKLEEQARSFGKVNLASKGDEKEAAAEKQKTSTEADESDSHNQVFGLIVGMLEIGSETQAFELIRWFQARGVNPLAYKPLTAQFCASVHALINDLYAPLSLKKMQLVASTTTSTTKKNVANGRRADGEDGAHDVAFLKPLATQHELVTVVFPILEMLGSQLHQDQLLFTKLLRIIGHLLESDAKKKTTKDKDDEEEEEDGGLMAKVKDVIVKSFLPAIARQESNPSSVFQLWDLVKLYPFDQRYRMYQQWQAAYASNPEMKLVEAQVVQHTRKVMRRLTADRAKPSARSLTHFAHSNPLVVFRTMLRQIQSYDNLIQPVVEAFKFITPLGMDVLSFVLVSELAKSRQSMKADGTNVSLWLTSLASFSGSFYRKYPNVELTGLLQYLIQRLQNWESVDLVVLSELLSKMGSCISFEDISLSQLEAQAGGPHLWYEPADPKLMNRRAIPRLRDALVKRDLALPLCLLICQMRSRIEFQESSPLTHLKLLGRVYDTCQMTLSQLLQFLNGVVDPLVYTKMLPPIATLVNEYHILPELAMTLCRPAIRFDDPVLRKAPRSIHSTGSSSSSGSENGADGRASWFMNSPALIADVDNAIRGATGVDKDPFAGVTKDFYVTFWSLILYDIHVPFPQYEAEILRLRNSMNTATSGANGNLTGTERKKLKEKTTQMIDKLTNEQKDQVAHRKRVYERLEEKKKTFFAREAADSRTAVQELLQKCVIPRALLSPEDALFCAKFMERIHFINTPEFSALQYYNMINTKLPSIVLCVTEREAGNFGIFLKESVTLLYRWYQSGATYEEDALHGKSGFSLDLHDPKKKLAHRQYKLLYAKWHKGMAKIFSTTLASGEYMPIRTTLIILTKLTDVFPASKSTAESMLEIVETLTKEDREDIKIMAKRYFALLTKRKATLIEDKLLYMPVEKKLKDVGKSAKNVADEDAAGAEKDGTAGNPSSSSAASAAATDGTTSAEEEKAASPPSSSSSDAASRKLSRALRQDLESGEISSPPAPSAAVTSSSSSRRSNERSAAASGNEGAKDERGGGRSSSGGSRLKRRDSDRVVAGDESSASSSRHGDEKRGRRETREASPGKPPLSSAPASGSGSRGSSNATSTEPSVASGHKRGRSRERRSRSAESRRNGRERERERGGTPAPANEREMNNSNSSSSGRPSETQKSESGEQSGENRKRQRVEQSEAALRRQLTKDQEARREARERQETAAAMNSSSKAEPASRESDGGASTSRVGERGNSAGASRDAGERPDRSERQQPAASAPGAASGSGSGGTTTRKIVSLVSSSRKREAPSQEDDARQGSTSATAGGESGDHHDEKRRRDAGRSSGSHGGRGGESSGGGGGGGGGSNARGGESGAEQKHRGSGDDKKNRGGGGQDRRGSGQGRGNDDRGNGGGGGGGGAGGRRRDERRGRR